MIGVPSNILFVFYLISLIIYIYFAYQYRHNAITLLIITIFFAGPFSYFIPSGTQYIRLITFIWSCYIFVKQNLYRNLIKYKWLMLSFVAFSLYFVFDTILIIGDKPVQVFSQYSKYFIPFVILLSMSHYGKRNVNYLYAFNNLFFKLIVAQVLITIVKFIVLNGNWTEGMVGTYGGVRGGGSGTALPLVMLCWVALNTNMEIQNWRKWILVLASFLFIGIMTGKRAIIFLLPILFVILSTVVARQKYFKVKQLLYIILVAPLLLYFGVRLSPSLNPENKRWGSFDIEYAWNYAMDYSFGKADITGDRGVGHGRMGANLLLWEYIIDTDNYTQQSLFGHGVIRAYKSNDMEDYYDSEYNFGAEHRGALTGIFMLYIALGIFGLILCILYYWFLFSLVRYQRLRWVLFGLMMFDFMFYNNTMMREPALHIIIMFCVVFSQIQYTTKGDFVGYIFPFFDKVKKLKR